MTGQPLFSVFPPRGTPSKELGFHLIQCIGVSLIAKYIAMLLYFRAKKRVDAGGSFLGVRGRPSVFSNKVTSLKLRTYLPAKLSRTEPCGDTWIKCVQMQ
jgi:hypothetical protein